MSTTVNSQDFDRAANDALFSKDNKLSLLYSILTIVDNQSDWCVIRLAANVNVLYGPDKALLIYERFDNANRGCNFLLHKCACLISTGEKDKSLSIIARITILPQIDNFNPSMLVPIFEFLIAGKYLELRHQLIALFWSAICSHPWLFNAIWKQAKDNNSLEVFVDAIQGQFSIRRIKESHPDVLRDIEFMLITCGRFDAQMAGHLDVPDGITGEFYEYYQLNSVAGAKQIVSAMTAVPIFLHPKQFVELIEDAIQDRIGFSFVRIGDGEGRFLGTRLSAYPAIWGETVAIAKRIWFWNSSEFPPPAFFSLLEDAYLRASIVGINPIYRLELESRNSLIGYVGVTNGNRFMYEHLSNYKGVLCNNWDNVVLDNMNFYRRLPVIAKRSCASICIVSPHQNLKDRIDWLSNAESHEILIPSEGHRAIQNESLAEPHYPDVYDRVCNFIDNRTGDVFLIAAGVFAKLYCERARLAGNIAIDIGSILDKWLSYNTR